MEIWKFVSLSFSSLSVVLDMFAPTKLQNKVEMRAATATLNAGSPKLPQGMILPPPPTLAFQVVVPARPANVAEGQPYAFQVKVIFGLVYSFFPLAFFQTESYKYSSFVN